jgi:hypothetical protein
MPLAEIVYDNDPDERLIVWHNPLLKNADRQHVRNC